MGPPSYLRSVVDRYVVMRRIPVQCSRVPQFSYHLQLAFHIYPVCRCYITHKSSLKKQITIKISSLLFPICFTNSYLFVFDRL